MGSLLEQRCAQVLCEYMNRFNGRPPFDLLPSNKQDAIDQMGEAIDKGCPIKEISQ